MSRGTTPMRIVFALLLCFPLLSLTGCSPSYVPAPVVDLDAAQKEAEAPPPPEPEPEPAPKPAPAPVVVDAPRPEFYDVKSGDTLAAIALNFGLSHRDIALWNGMTNPDILRVGERLRLTPPENQPVATAIGGTKEKLALTETNPSGETGETALTPKAPGSGSGSEGGSEGGESVLRPQSTIAGGTGAALPEGGAADSNPGWSGGGGFVKTGPLAEGFAYSKQKLQEMRAEWESRNATAPQPAALAPAPTPAPAPAPSTNENETEGEGDGPQAVRRAFGIQWSWPARGRLLSGFSDSSRGWDIGGESGDSIYSAADGKVIYAGSGIKGFGRLVIVKHDNDYLSAYAHNRRILMKEGARVRRGDLIAEMGDSGAERVKLHFEIRKAGKPTDPVEFLPERP